MPSSKRALTVIEPSKLQLSRYLRFQAGMLTGEIAEQDGVTEERVKRAISAVEVFRKSRSLDHLSEAVVDVFLKLKDHTAVALEKALQAKTKDDNGTVIEDHNTQIKAVEALTEMANVIQPKAGKGTTVQVGVGVNASQPPMVQVRGFEERMAEIRGRVREHNLLPSETADVYDPDAEVIDAEEENDESPASQPRA